MWIVRITVKDNGILVYEGPRLDVELEMQVINIHAGGDFLQFDRRYLRKKSEIARYR